MTSQTLTKGLNEPANMLITFMVSIWKITGLNLMFSGSKGKPSSQANYGNTLVKLNVINKTIIFSIWLLQKLEVLRFPVSLSDELGRLSPWVQKSQEVFETLKREEFT